MVEVLRIRKLHIAKTGFTFSPNKEYIVVQNGLKVFDYAFRCDSKIESGRVTDISREAAKQQVISLIHNIYGMNVSIQMPRN